MAYDILRAMVLGLVEGVTEFLPISSTGHLILVNQWLSFTPEFTKLFDVVIQLGAIGAVVVHFWTKLWPFGQGQAHRRDTFGLWFKALVGVVPALVLGALFGAEVEARLFTPAVVALALVVGGAALIVLERRAAHATLGSIADLSVGTAVLIGLAQCLALVPGVSRSAATIVGAMLLGASRATAAEFSFYLAVPTMVAASGYSVLKHGLAIQSGDLLLLALGFVVSFLTALVVVRQFMGFIQRHSFTGFGYYRIALGLVVLVWLVL
jgi:undecaprenyl-diphosphatase